MQCAVWNCVNERKNKEAKKSFFVFPKDEKLREKWLDFCGRPPGFKPKTWRICMDHFKSADIVGDLAFEMGLRGKRTLVPGAVPCIYNDIPPNAEDEIKKLQKKERKRAAESGNEKPTVLTTTEENSAMTITTRPGLTIRKVGPNVSIPVTTNANDTPKNMALETSASVKTDVAFVADEVNDETVLSPESLQIQIQKLKQENFVLQQLMQREELRHQHEKYVLQEKIRKVELETKNLEERLLGQLPAEHMKVELIGENESKNILQQDGTSHNTRASMLGIIHEEQVNMEIVDHNLAENIENIMQQKLAEELIKKQLLDILPEDEIKMEFIEENSDADFEKDFMQQKLAEPNIMEHLGGTLSEEKIEVFQKNIEEAPLDIKTEPE